MGEKEWSEECQLRFTVPAVVSPDSSIRSHLFSDRVDLCDFLLALGKLQSVRVTRLLLKSSFVYWTKSETTKGKDQQHYCESQTDTEPAVRPKSISQSLELPVDLATEASTPGIFDFLHRKRTMRDAETQTERVELKDIKGRIFPEIEENSEFWREFVESDICDKAERLFKFENALIGPQFPLKTQNSANFGLQPLENPRKKPQNTEKSEKIHALTRLFRYIQKAERLDLTEWVREWRWRSKEASEFQKSGYSPSVSYQSIGEECSVQSPQGHFLLKTLELMSESNRNASARKISNISVRLVSKFFRGKQRAWYRWQIHSQKMEICYYRALLRTIDEEMQSARLRERVMASAQSSHQSRLHTQLSLIASLATRLLPY